MTTITTFKTRDTWIRALARDNDLTHAAFKVGARMAMSLRIETGELTLQKIECIADACAMARCTVILALRVLVERGWLRCARIGRYKANQYTLLSVSEIHTPLGSEIQTTPGSEIQTEVKRSKAKRSVKQMKGRAYAYADAPQDGFFGKDAQRESTAQAQGLAAAPRVSFSENDFIASDGSVKFTHEEIEELRADLSAITDVRAMVRQAFRWTVGKGMPPHERKGAMIAYLNSFNAKQVLAKKDQAERSALREREADAREKRREKRDAPYHLLP